MEACYNLARAYHHLGLIHIAATYYEMVLEPEGAVNDAHCDLKREAAHNVI